MKWLILLALVACGKYQEPKALDYKDNDGDQVLNYEETEFDKYIANYESIGSVKASLRFKINTVHELNLMNGEDLETRIEKLMVSNEKRIQKEEYFTEWAKLKVKEPVKIPALTKLDYEVSLEFEKNEGEVQEVFLESKKFSLHLGKWASIMSIKIPSSRLKEIANGEAHFVLRKYARKSPLFNVDVTDTIKSKTYRLLYSDGKKEKIYYVSKELDFNGVQKLFEAKTRKIENEDDFFFHSKELGKTEWIGREFSNGDKVLLFADTEKLKTRFFDNYTHQRIVVSRINGIPQNQMFLTNKSSANVYMRVRPLEQRMRTFEDLKVKRTYGEGGGGREGGASVKQTCHHHFRRIKNENNFVPDLNTLIATNNLMQDQKDFAGTLEQTDEKGLFWEMKLSSLPENANFGLNETNPAARVKIGEISPKCGESSGASEVADYEGKLSFEVESFVEKIP